MNYRDIEMPDAMLNLRFGYDAHQMREYAMACCSEFDEQITQWKEAYRKMRNIAAGYSNLVGDEVGTRRLEREWEEAEKIVQSLGGAR